MSYIIDIETLFDEYEKKKLSMEDIFFECIDLIKLHEFNKDFIFDLNDTLNYRGYNFQFLINKNKEQFDQNKYALLIKNATKSLDKTKKLIEYLNNIQDYRLTLASLHALKIKFLIKLNLLPQNNDLLNQMQQENYRDVLFASYNSDELFDIVYKVLEKIGIPYATLAYMKFRIDVEMLLWTIETNKNNGYLIVNAIKTILNIAPKEYFIRDNKAYYASISSLKIKNYLKLIDKDAIKIIKNAWKEEFDNFDMTGYKLLLLLV